MAAIRIRDARPEDAGPILDIYDYYVRNTAITFEYDTPSIDEFIERMEKTMLRYPYLVIEEDGVIAGYAYAGPFVGRAAYDWSCEMTVYLDHRRQKCGLGRRLYEALEEALRRMGILNLYACIGYPEEDDEYLTKNSADFHAHLGFVKVGRFHRCGYKFGRWYNMIWMEKLIGEHGNHHRPITDYPDLKPVKYQYVLFDLDGTLTDPGVGITNSVMYALKRFNISVEDRASLYRFIGPPLKDSFESCYGFSDQQSQLAIRYYREYFTRQGMFENKVYGGIPELLRQLKAQGRTLILATSKPEEFSEIILRHFQLYEYFDIIAGASMDGSRTRKEDVIRYALEKSGCSTKSSAVMIGDREHDIIGADRNGLDSIGVLFGYGSYEELQTAGATYIANRPEDILQYV